MTLTKQKCIQSSTNLYLLVNEIKFKFKNLIYNTLNFKLFNFTFTFNKTQFNISTFQQIYTKILQLLILTNNTIKQKQINNYSPQITQQTMQNSKKLTLQEYIECHNIKKQLQSRSKQKSRSKSKDKSISTHNHLIMNPNNPSERSLSMTLTQANNMPLGLSSHQELNKSIYDQVDFRARNLYSEIYASVNEIKLQCRGLIREDKDFAFFIKLMDQLMLKFRQGVMHIHRQNLILFQISSQADKNANLSKDELTKTFLQKSFDDRWNQSRTQYQANLNFIPTKTIKQKMNQTKRGENLVNTIFGGLRNTTSSNQIKKIMPKVYDSPPKNEEQRNQRKQQATSFLGFLLSNFGSTNKSQQIQQKVNSQKQLQMKNSNRPSALKQTKLSLTVSKSNNNQGEKIVKNINFLNSSGRVDINTEQIDRYYDQHNTSFGMQMPRESQESNKQIKVQNNFQSPKKTTDKKLLQNLESTKSKTSNMKHHRRQIINEGKASIQKMPNPQRNMQANQLGIKETVSSVNRNTRHQQPVLRRTNSRSKGKLVKGLIQRKPI